MHSVSNAPVSIITGANTGIGYETALALAQAGDHVIIACRSLEKGKRAADAIRAQTGSRAVECIQLDLASFASVRQFAGQIHESFGSIRTLICNAGIMSPPYRRTEDGFESQFQVNYLSHFLLAQLLMKPLLANGGGSIISVSSLLSERATSNTAQEFLAIGRVDKANYVPGVSYRESKLAQVIFTAEAHRRYHAAGLTTSAVHPGIVNTSLLSGRMPGWLVRLLQPAVWLGYASGQLLTPRQGAATSIYLAMQHRIASGQYWARKRPRTPNPRMHNQELGRTLWEASAALVGVGETINEW